MTVILVSLLIGAVAERRGNDASSARDQLARRLEGAPVATRFAMRYSRSGTRVLDCIAVNLRYTARVDEDAQRMTVSADRTNRVIAVVDTERLFLHRSLFAMPPGEDDWLRVRRPMFPVTREAINDALGVDLGATVTSARLPPNGAELTRAALDVARTVRDLGPTNLGTRSVDRFRVHVADEKYALVPTTQSATKAGDASAPIFDVWIDADNLVRRVGVRPGGDRPTEDGWTMDFSPVESVTRPDTSSATPLNADQVRALRAAEPGCELEVGG